MAARTPDFDRYEDLLVARATEGLDRAGHEELDKLKARHPDYDSEAMDRIAASVALAGLSIEPMPASLRARVEADAEAWFAVARNDADGAPAGASGPIVAPRGSTLQSRTVRRSVPVTTAWGGWLAAAAALVVAVVGWLQVDQLNADREALAARQAALQGDVARLERSLAERDAVLATLQPAEAELLARLQAQPDTVVLPWSATVDPTAEGAGGTVIWNSAEQAGLMRISGLQPNDPAVSQYQLWIFDAERDDRFPVDGGVFDVPAGVDEALVPIRARLPVGQAVLFAVTVESPGGVVVSSRERIALVAQPGA